MTYDTLGCVAFVNLCNVAPVRVVIAVAAASVLRPDMPCQ